MRKPFSVIQNVFPMVGRKGVCTTLYLYYATKGRVNISDYKGHHPQYRLGWIPLPSLETQSKIAAVLSAYDDLIENNTRRIQILEEMAQALYREWFVHFRFPGHEQSNMVESEMGLIPGGWDVRPLKSLTTIKSGFAFKSSDFVLNGRFKLVTIKNVQDGAFIAVCPSRLDKLPTNMPPYCNIRSGDILLSLTGNVGRVCVAYGTDYLLNQRVAKLVPLSDSYAAFVGSTRFSVGQCVI